MSKLVAVAVIALSSLPAAGQNPTWAACGGLKARPDTLRVLTKQVPAAISWTPASGAWAHRAWADDAGDTVVVIVRGVSCSFAQEDPPLHVVAQVLGQDRWVLLHQSDFSPARRGDASVLMRGAERELEPAILPGRDATRGGDYHITTATLTAAAGPPPAPYEPVAVTEEYDRFAGHTVVTLEGSHIGSELELSGLYVMPGRARRQPGVVLMSITSSAESWQYLTCHTVRLLADGRPFGVGETEHKGTVGRGYVLEFIGFQLSAARLVQLARSKVIEGRLCSTEFVLTQAQRDALREFAARMQRPAAK